MKHLKPTDVIPSIVSKDGQQGWIALDLGNIILHLFLQTQRDFYDLEMLWTVGPMFDDLYNLKDTEIIQLLNMIK
jgi:ribosomal silencing factor RsfS